MKAESATAAREWKLSRLTEGIGGVEAPAGGGTVVTALAYDSRRVRPGALFFALAGETTDGRLHIEEAARRGAAAVLHEGPLHGLRGLPAVRAEKARPAMGEI